MDVANSMQELFRMFVKKSVEATVRRSKARSCNRSGSANDTGVVVVLNAR